MDVLEAIGEARRVVQIGQRGRTAQACLHVPDQGGCPTGAEMHGAVVQGEIRAPSPRTERRALAAVGESLLHQFLGEAKPSRIAHAPPGSADQIDDLLRRLCESQLPHQPQRRLVNAAHVRIAEDGQPPADRGPAWWPAAIRLGARG